MNVAFSEEPSHNVEQECRRAEWTGLGGMTLTSVDKTVTHTEQWAQHKGCSCLQRHPQYFWHGKSYRWCQKFFLNKSETWEGEKLHHCWKMFSLVSGTVALNDYVFPHSGSPPGLWKSTFLYENLPVGSLCFWLSHHPVMQVTERENDSRALKQTEFIELHVGKEPKWVITASLSLPGVAPHLDHSGQKRRNRVF